MSAEQDTAMYDQPDEQNAPGFWIEYTDESGEDSYARWVSNVTDEKIDRILAFAAEVLGQPDTI